MIQLDWAAAAVIITVFLSLLGFAYGYGMLSNKVKYNRYDIEELKSCVKEGEDRHKKIYERLECLGKDMAVIRSKVMNDNPRRSKSAGTRRGS